MSGSSRSGIGALDLLLDGFAGYLRSERGVTELTVDVYVADIRRFLVDRGGGDLSELTAAEVSKAVLGQVTRWSPASVRRYGCSLRSFLRYCYLVGLVDRDLSAAALPVSGRRRSLLPKGITATQAKALLRACDRRRASGRRDYAVIVLILRLGLRASEGERGWPPGRGLARSRERLTDPSLPPAICPWPALLRSETPFRPLLSVMCLCARLRRIALTSAFSWPCFPFIRQRRSSET